ncbi:MAG: hypothetical protein NO117_03325 [Sulfolobales archaeon]|nr:hypothetical protein [Sulfolobales archaeon]
MITLSGSPANVSERLYIPLALKAWGRWSEGFESDIDVQYGETATERPRTAGDGKSDSRLIITTLRRMGYKNEILLNLNMFSDPAKFILLAAPQGTKQIALLYSELLEGKVNQIVQRMTSLRPDVGVMRFVDNELDRDRIIAAFRTE